MIGKCGILPQTGDSVKIDCCLRIDTADLAWLDYLRHDCRVGLYGFKITFCAIMCMPTVFVNSYSIQLSLFEDDQNLAELLRTWLDTLILCNQVITLVQF